MADASGTRGDDDELMPDELAALTREQMVVALEKEMLAAAKRLEFERAASLRDRIEEVLATLPASDGADGVADGSTALRKSAARRMTARARGGAEESDTGGAAGARHLYPPAPGERTPGAGHPEGPPPRRHPKRTTKRLPRKAGR